VGKFLIRRPAADRFFPENVSDHLENAPGFVKKIGEYSHIFVHKRRIKA
jgi:hypothetical protein